jgi:hypothetical protein
MTYGTRTCLAMCLALLGGCQLDIEAEAEDEGFADGGAGEQIDERTGVGAEWEGGAPSWEPSPESSATPRPIDPYRELVVVDPSVVQSEYASNTVDAPLGLRAQMAWLSGATSDDGLAFTVRWLDRWATLTSAGEYLAPVTPRPAVRDTLLVPWVGSSLRSSEGHDPDADWKTAPFLLIAIVNRADLALAPDAHAAATHSASSCGGTGGELRFVYTALVPGRQTPLPMTVIIEIPYSDKLTTASWARAFHDIAGLPPGNDYNRELADFVTRVRAAADPAQARVRTNEEAFASPWELREFAVEGSPPELVLRPLEFTPRADVEQKRIETHLAAHADEVMRGPVSLPEELRAAAARLPSPDFRWASSTLGFSVSDSFSRETCNGCHGGDTQALPFQHIALDEAGTFPARLSRFLDDPDSSSDELGRRLLATELLVSGSCD